MKKEDLKTGMVVITKNNNWYIVLLNSFCQSIEGDILLGPTGFLKLFEYGDDLTVSVRGFDIEEVFVSYPNTLSGFLTIGFSSSSCKQIWKRPKIYEYTMGEIAAKFDIPVEQLRIKE